MKKGLIAAGLLVSLSGTAQDVSTYTPGTMGEGVVYYLPKTEIELQVIATSCLHSRRILPIRRPLSAPDRHIIPTGRTLGNKQYQGKFHRHS